MPGQRASEGHEIFAQNIGIVNALHETEYQSCHIIFDHLVSFQEIISDVTILQRYPVGFDEEFGADLPKGCG